MTVDQAEIAALLNEADGLAAEAAHELSAPEAVQFPPPAPAAPEPAADPELARILKLRVPVIVQLAARGMPVSSIRDLSVGAIIEFEKSVEDTLDLLVNNHLIGHGHCVRVGENFGLQIAHICDQTARVRSMGRA